MDPMTMQMLIMMAGQAGKAFQPQQPQMPTGPALAPPTVRPITNVPTDQGILAHTMGGPESLDIGGAGAGSAALQPGMVGSPAGATPVADSSLAGLSKLGAESITQDDVALGRSLLG